MITHYKSSKGEKPIADMPFPYAANALAKLRRDEPSRTAEIEALAAHCAALEAGQADTPAPIGDNGGPPLVDAAPAELAAWDAIKAHFDDLLTEAGNWADGVAVVNQDQADAVARLRQDLQQAITAADAARVTEKQPLDEQIAEIQDRYNAYIAPLKNKKPGTISKAVSALGNLLTAWLTKLDDEKRAREREAAAIAAKAAADAMAAHVEAKTSTDLDVIDRADDAMASAEALLKQAKGIASEKVQAQGGTRAVGLRTFWIAEMIEGKGVEAVRHYLATKPDRVREFIQGLADEDVRSGARALPGFNIREEKRV